MASDDVVQGVNEAIKGGSIKAHDGATLSKEIEGGLIREDGRVLYPVRDGIPIMLISESIQLPQQA